MDRALALEPADLVVLDLMMPGEDGLAICRRLRPGGPPILMLSAVGETTDRIVGLELGADDYLPKPFEPRELLARLRAVLRRPPGGETGVLAGAVLGFAGWRMELGSRTLLDPEGRMATLSPGAWALLRPLLDHPGRVLSRDRLMDLTGSDGDSFDRAVDLRVSRLRRKLEDGGGAALIETVRGEGYRFTATVQRL
jgi:two-component system OmpR family response regulator